ncbi:hypothetical protein JIN84_15890 [Luteolibacter yonseiensis]|uniref:PEP-CTERM protein-sorting domain-containing protein n=1 Tax=Luteolibacter yonseiensis TaxID=1144680 RepID=A0A934VCL6_9BACT|nr:hypothetical protein [Luteolibacter yonseiensis]MBK1817101.1 hypothetical protein [Luteolibacter yonseiensis]
MKTYLVGIAVLATIQSPAPAATIYSGSQNLTVSAVDLEGIYINFETGSIVNVFPAGFDDGPWLNITLGGYGIFNGELLRPVAVSATSTYDPEEETDHYLNVPVGTTIDVSSAFMTDAWASQYHTAATAVAGKFVPDEPGILAFEFTKEAGSTIHHGWLRFIPGNVEGTIVDWAFEDTPGQAIQAGIIPEPSSVAIATVVLFGTMLGRRRI